MNALKYLLPAALAASMLCSCSKTPGDIESSAAASVTDESAVPQKSEYAVPASEAAANAEKELRQLKDLNGIFKLDGCNITVPVKERFGVYEVRRAGAETPRELYDVYNYLAEALTGGALSDSDLTFISKSASDGAGVGAESFLAQERTDFQIVNTNAREIGVLELDSYDQQQYHSSEWLSVTNDFYSQGKLFKDRFLSERIFPLTADSGTLSREISLISGKSTVSDCVSAVSEFLASSPLYTDGALGFIPHAVSLFEIYDGRFLVDVDMLGTLDGVPFVGISLDPFADEMPFGISSVCSGASADAQFLRPGKLDSLLLSGSNSEYIRRPEEYDITEIVPVSRVFEAIKDKLSNQIVYDVREVTLGFAAVSYGADEQGGEISETRLFWNIYMETVNKGISITADAQTGELSIYAHDKDI